MLFPPLLQLSKLRFSSCLAETRDQTRDHLLEQQTNKTDSTQKLHTVSWSQRALVNRNLQKNAWHGFLYPQPVHQWSGSAANAWIFWFRNRRPAGRKTLVFSERDDFWGSDPPGKRALYQTPSLSKTGVYSKKKLSPYWSNWWAYRTKREPAKKHSWSFQGLWSLQRTQETEEATETAEFSNHILQHKLRHVRFDAPESHRIKAEKTSSQWGLACVSQKSRNFSVNFGHDNSHCIL